MKTIYTIIVSSGSYNEYQEYTLCAYENEQDAKADRDIIAAVREQLIGERWSLAAVHDVNNKNHEAEYIINRFPQLKNLKMQFISNPDKDNRIFAAINWSALTEEDFYVDVHPVTLL